MAGRGYLVCGDITGYTAYLSHSELEHATGILADLLRVLLGRVRHPLRLSRIEGDAVVAYVPPGDRVAGAELVSRVDDAYVAFRRALELMVLNTTCTCNACANISALDLKFIVHHGEFVVQRIGQQDELVGPEVNLMFRLAKNRIRDALGMPGYVAFTADAVTAIGPGEGLQRHEESDAERGAVVLWVRDMAPVWELRRGDPVFPFPEKGAVRVGRDIPAPVAEVWEVLTRPDLRMVVQGAEAMEVEGRLGGEIGLESVYLCAHGDKIVRQTVVDWSPGRHYVVRSPMGGAFIDVRFAVEPISTGTRVVIDVAFEGGLRASLMRRLAGRMMRSNGEDMLDRVAALATGG